MHKIRDFLDGDTKSPISWTDVALSRAGLNKSSSINLLFNRSSSWVVGLTPNVTILISRMHIPWLTLWIIFDWMWSLWLWWKLKWERVRQKMWLQYNMVEPLINRTYRLGCCLSNAQWYYHKLKGADLNKYTFSLLNIEWKVQSFKSASFMN